MAIRSLWSKLFGRHLMLTNTVTSGVLFSLGDGIQQGIEFKSKTHLKSSYDWKRTGKLFVIGIISGAPHHYFYVWLDKIYSKRNLKTVAKKILIDQLVAAPMFAFIFIIGAGTIEGKSLKNSMTEFRTKFPFIYLFDWLIWPPSQGINFYYVPTRYRVLYVNMVTVIWDVFLSYMKHYDQRET